MRCQAPIMLPCFHQLSGNSEIHVFTDMDIRHRVVVLRPGRMTIASHPASSGPGTDLIGHHRQGPQEGLFFLLKYAVATTRAFLECLGVIRRDLLGDGCFQLRQAGKRAVTQCCDDHGGDMPDGVFHRGFIFGCFDPARQDCGLSNALPVPGRRH